MFVFGVQWLRLRRWRAAVTNSVRSNKRTSRCELAARRRAEAKTRHDDSIWIKGDEGATSLTCSYDSDVGKDAKEECEKYCVEGVPEDQCKLGAFKKVSHDDNKTLLKNSTNGFCQLAINQGWTSIKECVTADDSTPSYDGDNQSDTDKTDDCMVKMLCRCEEK